MEVKRKLKTGGAKVVSGAMSVVLAVGLMPLPAFANNLQATGLSTQAVTTQDISGDGGIADVSGYVKGAAFAAAEPAPEILGLNGPEYRGSDDMTSLWKMFGQDSVNEFADPYLYNWNGGDPIGTPTIMAGSRSGGPMAAAPTYGSSTAGDKIWDQLPEIIIGTGADSIPANEHDFYDNAAYARAVEKAHSDVDSDTYHPIGVTYDRIDLNHMIATMYRIAEAADEAIEESKDEATDQATLKTRYEDPMEIAQNYERYITGTKGYVKEKIDDGTVPQRTVALVQSHDDVAGTYTIISDGVSEGTATQNRFLEAVQGVTTNYFDTLGASGTTATVTANQLKNVDVILVGGQASSDSTGLAANLASDGLQSKTFWCKDMSVGAVFGVTVNSVENAQNVGRILPCVYPEILDQSDFVAYYYDTFYHIKSGKVASVVAEHMDGVRNWGKADSQAYLAWEESDVSDYKEAEVQAIIEEGMGYLNALAADGDVYLSDVLTPYTDEKVKQLKKDNSLADDTLSLSNATVSVPNAALADDSGSTTGKSAKPEPVVTYGSRTLVKGTDYTVEYENNTAVGTGTINITGTGSYKDTVTKTFRITSANFSDNTVKVTIGGEESGSYSANYTGAAITPEVAVALNTSKATALKEGTDYTVAYSNNINAGTATVTISGTGTYTGTITKTFSINKTEIGQGSDVTVVVSDQTYNLGDAISIPSSDVIVMYNGVAIPSSNYTVSTSDTKASDKATATVAFQGNNIALVSGQSNPTATFTIAARDLNAEGTLASEKAVAFSGDLTYTGSAIVPTSTVTNAKNVALTIKTDYSVAYSNNTNAGTAYAIITGAGNYSGSYVVADAFTIAAKELTKGDLTVDKIASQKLVDGKAEPKVSMKWGKIDLVEGTDYTLSYQNNTLAGTGKVLATFKGNYSGSDVEVAEFTIANTDNFTDSDITVEAIADQTYTGAAIEPTLTVKKGDDLLALNTDFLVEYSNNTNVGTATVKVSGTGAYTGEITKTFNIVKKTIGESDTVSVDYANEKQAYTYSGSAIAPTAAQLKVTVNGTVIPSSQYTVNTGEGKNVNAGNYTANVVFTGTNIEGSTTKSYTIDAFELKNASGSGRNAVAATGSATIANQLMTGSEIVLAEKDVTTAKAIFGQDKDKNDITKDLAFGTDYTVKSSTPKTGWSTLGDTVTVTFEGKGNYKGTFTSTYVLKGDISTAVVVIPEQTYTGSAIVPDREDMIVTVGGVLLTTSDYTISAVSNTEVGTATATLTGANKYAGEVEADFNIVPADISDAVIFMGDMEEPVAVEGKAYEKYSTAYTGQAIEPAIRVFVGEDQIELKQDEGFYVSYDNNTAATDQAAFSVYGDGVNLTGNFDGYFTIARRSLAASTVTATTAAKFAFASTDGNTSKVAPAFTVKDTALNYTLKANTDYTVRSTTVGKVAGAKVNVQVVGKGNYSAAKFQSAADQLTVVSPTITVANATYTGKALSPKVTVKVGSTTLKQNTDYTVAYKNNTNAGTGTVTITGKGQYAGTAIQDFTISQAANPLTLKAAKSTIAYSKVKSKAQTIAFTTYRSKAGQGTMTCKITKQVNAKKKAVTYFSVNKTSGAITVKKGTAKGTYTLTMQVSAAGNANYKASGNKTATVTVTVK